MRRFHLRPTCLKDCWEALGNLLYGDTPTAFELLRIRTEGNAQKIQVQLFFHSKLPGRNPKLTES
eukprot:2040558-Amphidinium_carterae.1